MSDLERHLDEHLIVVHVTERIVRACEWYALCPNPADGTVSHPVLGDVPTCERCAAKHGLELKPYTTGAT